MDKQWMRRRWFDFRNGHSVYLIFALTFANFVLIFHRLLIERIPVLNEVFSNLWIFAIVFILIYIPVAILVGAWHRKTQLRVEADVIMRQNPLWAKGFRVLMDMQEGKITKEEIKQIRDLLTSIEQGKGQG